MSIVDWNTTVRRSTIRRARRTPGTPGPGVLTGGLEVGVNRPGSG